MTTIDLSHFSGYTVRERVKASHSLLPRIIQETNHLILKELYFIDSYFKINNDLIGLAFINCICFTEKEYEEYANKKLDSRSVLERTTTGFSTIVPMFMNLKLLELFTVLPDNALLKLNTMLIEDTKKKLEVLKLTEQPGQEILFNKFILRTVVKETHVKSFTLVASNYNVLPVHLEFLGKCMNYDPNFYSIVPALENITVYAREGIMDESTVYDLEFFYSYHFIHHIKEFILGHVNLSSYSIQGLLKAKQLKYLDISLTTTTIEREDFYSYYNNQLETLKLYKPDKDVLEFIAKQSSLVRFEGREINLEEIREYHHLLKFNRTIINFSPRTREMDLILRRNQLVEFQSFFWLVGGRSHGGIRELPTEIFKLVFSMLFRKIK